MTAQAPALASASEQELIDELVERGWSYRETSIPLGANSYKGEPMRRVRSLMHQDKVPT